MNNAEFTIAMSSVLMGVCIYSLLVTRYSLLGIQTPFCHSQLYIYVLKAVYVNKIVHINYVC